MCRKRFLVAEKALYRRGSRVRALYGVNRALVLVEGVREASSWMEV